MSYTAVPTVATGSLWTAANHNTYIRDNLDLVLPAVLSRQGGSATSWAVSGTTDYDAPNDALVQMGMIEWTGSASATGGGMVTFPTTFGYIPLVFLTINAASTAQRDITVTVADSNQVGYFDYYWEDTGGGTHTSVEIQWLAFGPLLP